MKKLHIINNRKKKTEEDERTQNSTKQSHGKRRAVKYESSLGLSLWGDSLCFITVISGDFVPLPTCRF